MQNQKPMNWHEVYNGSREKRFFVGLDGNSGIVRGRDGQGKPLVWRSAKGISADSGLSVKEVETLIHQYHGSGIVVNSPNNKDHWGYWKNVESMLKTKPDPLGDVDKEERIGKVAGSTMTSSKKKSSAAASQSSPAVGAPGSGGNAPPAPSGGQSAPTPSVP